MRSTFFNLSFSPGGGPLELLVAPVLPSRLPEKFLSSTPTAAGWKLTVVFEYYEAKETYSRI